MALQTTPCKHCGFEEYEYGSTLSSYYTVERISREPIKSMKCISCGSEMQLYYQEHHRRFYKCWECGQEDADKIYYESVQFEGFK